jgi:hypothetical protein
VAAIRSPAHPADHAQRRPRSDDRIVGHFEDMLVANNGPQARELMSRVRDLPEDLEAWVMAGA